MEDYRDKKGENLVKYVAGAIQLDEGKCRETLQLFFPEDAESGSDVEREDGGEASSSGSRKSLPHSAKKRRSEYEVTSQSAKRVRLDGLNTSDVEKLNKLSSKSLEDFLAMRLREGLDKKEVDRFKEEVDTCNQVLGFARSLSYQNYRIINDPIHGTIELHPLLVKIIDSPYFQRLRHIKQLGGVSYVFPGATHTRFEHSIGVCHLAGEVMRNLKTKQPELGLTEQDVFCVEIAGLCHDLGHGPFSHMFEWVAKEICKDWEHEDISCKVVDELAKQESVKDAFQRFRLCASDIEFVKSLIRGKQEKERQDKPYLYKIVANKDSGCDVDKWDYFARDCHYLGIPCDFDFRRFIKGIRVATDSSTDSLTPKKELCFRDKEVKNVYGMFHTRGVIHQKALQHKTSQVIQHMMCEALLKAKDLKLLNDSTLSGVVKEAHGGDLAASGWNQLDDRFLFLITTATAKENSEIGEHTSTAAQEHSGTAAEEKSITQTEGPKILLKAKKILGDIESRNIYKFLGQIRVDKDQCEFFHKVFQSKHDITEHVDDRPQGLLVLVALISQSSESKKFPKKNPVDNVKFYRKEDPTKVFAIKSMQVSDVVKPTVFSETFLQIFNKGDSNMSEQCWSKVKTWAESYKSDKGQLVFEPVPEFQDRYLMTTLPRQNPVEKTQ